MPETWKIDLEAGTATHPDGWVFEFRKDPDGAYSGTCTGNPEPFSLEDALAGARLAREAGEAYLAALRVRH